MEKILPIVIKAPYLSSDIGIDHSLQGSKSNRSWMESFIPRERSNDVMMWYLIVVWKFCDDFSLKKNTGNDIVSDFLIRILQHNTSKSVTFQTPDCMVSEEETA